MKYLLLISAFAFTGCLTSPKPHDTVTHIYCAAPDSLSGVEPGHVLVYQQTCQLDTLGNDPKPPGAK